ncbi:MULTISPECIES: hypothetical protein [unclassified Hoeflea]|uniref:hypothetical protein n=1 Tax=unclassified Hoeflea TaxID=2614931 RepID=UPI0039902BC3
MPTTAIEITRLLPLRHFMGFARVFTYRHADSSIVEPEFLWTLLLDAVFLRSA